MSAFVAGLMFAAAMFEIGLQRYWRVGAYVGGFLYFAIAAYGARCA